MKKHFLPFITLILISCGEAKEEKIPDFVLDKEQFSDLICDFTLAESAANVNIKNVPIEKFDSVYAFNPLVDRNVSKAKYDTSMYYYSHHPALFKEVYEMALEKLSRFQASRK